MMYYHTSLYCSEQEISKTHKNSLKLKFIKINSFLRRSSITTLEVSAVVVSRCSSKWVFLKFSKFHRKTSESFFDQLEHNTAVFP